MTLHLVTSFENMLETYLENFEYLVQFLYILNLELWMNNLLLLDLGLTKHLTFWKEFEFLRRNSKYLQKKIFLNFLF